jgi:hypothetical protein
MLSMFTAKHTGSGTNVSSCDEHPARVFVNRDGSGLTLLSRRHRAGPL